ncbi:MAG: M15 family metallopeptidase [Leptolyngbyaceae cyanobacterium MO_188.B28]|nr:M15 family metallopeptidase [Leptolyngbyaceae cyanobacterium MO_188.B28]
MKPYQTIPIIESGGPLVPIPLDRFAAVKPHPYEALGAPYGARSPYYLRQDVLQRLIQAQEKLQQQQSGWRIQIFDAYRPVAVQQFMVEYTFNQQVEAMGLTSQPLTQAQAQKIWGQVYQFWAVPSSDAKYPPPHSTGAAVDVSLVDETGAALDMGSPIDELSDRSFPAYFSGAVDAQEQQYHHNRQLLNRVMQASEFRRHPNEWWHFSQGDQMWAWLSNQQHGHTNCIAQYGRVD